MDYCSRYSGMKIVILSERFGIYAVMMYRVDGRKDAATEDGPGNLRISNPPNITVCTVP